MATTSETAELLDATFGARADKTLKIMQRRLPDADVRAFAKEVMFRLAQRVQQADAKVYHPNATEIEELATALISSTPDTSTTCVIRALSEGMTIEAVYVELLAPAARRLGELWDSDEVNFVEVTVGTGRIYTIMRRLVSSRIGNVKTRDRTAIIATLPGEQHTLGARMAADLARLDGWDIQLFTGASHTDLIDKILQSRVGVIAISLGNKERIGALSSLVSGIRSADSTLRILVSGRIADIERQAMNLIKPDAIETDVIKALAQLETLHCESCQARSRR